MVSLVIKFKMTIAQPPDIPIPKEALLLQGKIVQTAESFIPGRRSENILPLLIWTLNAGM